MTSLTVCKVHEDPRTKASPEIQSIITFMKKTTFINSLLLNDHIYHKQPVPISKQILRSMKSDTILNALRNKK